MLRTGETKRRGRVTGSQEAEVPCETSATHWPNLSGSLMARKPGNLSFTPIGIPSRRKDLCGIDMTQIYMTYKW